MKLWHQKTHFASSAHGINELIQFINIYNGAPTHKTPSEGLPPEGKRSQWVYPEKL